MPLEKRIIKRCEERNIAFEILFTSAKGDYDFLRAKIERELITDIVICGGDGSLSPIIASLINIKINIGIIPLGSGNGLARTAGIPNNIDKAFEIIFTGKAICVDAFLINEKISCHASGLGFDALVAHEFSKQKTRGLSSYTKQALRNFFTARTYSFLIEAGDSQFSVEAFLICLANSNQFGNNFKIAPKASLSDGLIDIVVIKKTNKLRVVFSFVRQILSGEISHLMAKDFHKKNVLYFQTSKITIRNPNLAPLHIDGDPAETAKKFSIEVLPSAYRLIQP